MKVNIQNDQQWCHLKLLDPRISNTNTVPCKMYTWNVTGTVSVQMETPKTILSQTFNFGGHKTI